MSSLFLCCFFFLQYFAWSSSWFSCCCLYFCHWTDLWFYCRCYGFLLWFFCSIIFFFYLASQGVIHWWHAVLPTWQPTQVSQAIFQEIQSNSQRASSPSIHPYSQFRTVFPFFFWFEFFFATFFFFLFFPEDKSKKGNSYNFMVYCQETRDPLNIFLFFGVEAGCEEIMAWPWQVYILNIKKMTGWKK